MKHLLLLFLLACGASNPPDSSTPSAREVYISKADALKPYLEPIDKVFDGDVTLFAGLTCLSGEKPACDVVKASQDASGKWFRNPKHEVRAEEGDFSRDQALGVLAYSIKTRDVAAFKRWVSYIEAHNYKMCANAPDNRCIVTPNLAGLIAEVADSLGVLADMPSYIRASRAGDDTTLLVEATNNPKGFRLHLVAVQIYLRQQTGTYTSTLKKAAAKLVEREPNNPFFLLVSEGMSDKLLELASQTIPDKPLGHDWAFQRDDSEKAWERSSGWEYVALRNLL